MGQKVVVLGGGVAGLTAAHELMERGFEVEVYEFKMIPGGKARSMPFTGSGKDGRADLPGEHGFRLFPKFYRHVIDTMKRIPDEKGTVFNHLVEVPRLDIATTTHPLVELVAKMNFTIEDLKAEMRVLFDNGLGLSGEDLDHYVAKLWQVMTSSDERIENEYQDIPWWEFIDADKYSPAFRNVFGNITKTLVACKSTRANTKTVGTVAAQMTMDILTPGTSFVRILNGPTNDRWINPWVSFLRANGVKYYTEAKAERIHYSDDRITGAEVSIKGGEPVTVTGDYYICAFPVEVMAGFIPDDMAEAHHDMANIRLLAKSVDWMNGIQFYLKEDVPVTPGHVMYFDSPWALTSISQRQFWPAFDWSKYGDGTVKGVLSVDISDWETEGVLFGKPAMHCTPEEIRQEVWEQLKRGLNVGQELLRDDVLHSYFLDTDIHFDNPHETVNLEPLLINEVGTWQLRPNAYTSIPNLFLASDYVRTNTDLATMEGANEAARRAVNAILHAANSKAKPCKIWEMYQYDVLGIDWLAPWHAHDRHRFHRGQPWDGKIL
ncbi:hydroxysqualene dehydroxylase [Paenibacillus turpanensis]|uniref:hydroxysqualene dehydroxylase n=1 Tax=Paenibacillus turpanensis TaxID=2689078 RepID=UPI00140AAAEA|nr:FAD-dependent oxidoreductase [Paenibacillus turpanensis]